MSFAVHPVQPAIYQYGQARSQVDEECAAIATAGLAPSTALLLLLEWQLHNAGLVTELRREAAGLT